MFAGSVSTGEIMPANISLAFQWRGDIEDVSELARALRVSGLSQEFHGSAQDGTLVAGWRLPVDGEVVELTCHCYDSSPWVSTTLDIEESRFDELAARIGRPRAIRTFIELAVKLQQELGLAYVFFDEEAEADICPETYDGEHLFGITILPSRAPWLKRVLERDDLRGVERLDHSVVVFKRLDPVPHHS